MILSLAVLAAMTVSFRAGAQDILSATVSRDTILIGDQVEWKSRIKVPKGMSVKIDSMSGYVVPGVELIGDFKVDTVDRKKDFSMVETRAVVTSFDSGSYVLPPLVVYFYRDGQGVDTMRLPEVPLEVTTVPIDTTTYQMYDIRPQFRYPVTFKELVPWILLLAALVAVVVLTVHFALKRKKTGMVFGKPDPKDPPHIVALRSLDRFGIKTIERTSNEILVDLSVKDLAPSDYEALKELFGTADLVKFAKYSATEAENENAVPVAVRFVNDTFMQELEADGKATEGGRKDE